MIAQGKNGRIVELFRDELALCEVGPGQTVTVLSEGDQVRDYAEASLAAARGVRPWITGTSSQLPGDPLVNPPRWSLFASLLTANLPASTAVSMAVQFGYNCHGFEGYLENVGLLLLSSPPSAGPSWKIRECEKYD